MSNKIEKMSERMRCALAAALTKLEQDMQDATVRCQVPDPREWSKLKARQRRLNAYFE
jgi:hypothetical protein